MAVWTPPLIIFLLQSLLSSSSLPPSPYRPALTSAPGRRVPAPHPLSGPSATSWGGCAQTKVFVLLQPPETKLFPPEIYPLYVSWGKGVFAASFSLLFTTRKLSPERGNQPGTQFWFLMTRKKIPPTKLIRQDSKSPAIQGLVEIFGCAVLGPREC